LEEKRLRLERIKNKYHVFYGDELIGEFPVRLIKEIDLKDEKISEGRFLQILRDYFIPYTKERVLRLITYRQRSEKETREYLNRHKFSKAITDAIIEDFKRAGLIDDLSFAESFALSRFQMKPVGKFYIKQELKKKGISSEIIQRILSNYDEGKALKNAYERAKKIYPGNREKKVKFLMRRGFDISMIFEIINE